jgi:rhamnosyl/mannosyltransferase
MKVIRIERMPAFNVLQFGKYFPPAIGGMEKIIFLLAEGVNRSGISCDVLCSNTTRVETIETDRGYTVYRAKSYGVIFSMAIAPSLIRLLWRVRKRYNVIHFHHPDPMSGLALFLVRPKAKLVVHWHLDIVKQKYSYFLYRPIEKWILSRAARIVVTSPPYLESSIPLRRHKHKCVVIPLGIESPSKHMPAFTNECMEKTTGKFVVFALGRFTAYKGFIFLVRAAVYLPDDILVIIGGDGGEFQAVKREVERLGVSHKVWLTGRLTDKQLDTYFNVCNAFCLPSISRNEAFGLVLLEAMARSKPVVATNIVGSGTSWVSQHGRNGVNVPPCDSTRLAEAIIWLKNHPKAASELGRNGHARFFAQFESKKMVEATISLYNEINR